jgi:N utilization substance protein B
MRKRSEERKVVLEILFARELNPNSVEEIIQARKACGEAVPSEFGQRLISGIFEHLNELDSLIEKYAENWRVERMPLTDRNILRLALYEIIYETDIPVGVSINEAVELAKTYGTDDSGRFVNGLLGRLVREELALGEGH